ncbi:MAG: FAD-dependent oxidoreductase [Bacteroidetes bacterium]|nr:FAD-dependent oxidoreductase [Bacteroidota bacterium]
MESIAIVGTGIAGMGCGHFLHGVYDIEFYEQNDYVGGHTNTVYIEEEGKSIPIDTGFIVFNNETYPNLVKLFKQLNVEVKPTNMSFSVQHLPSRLEYGSQQLFAQPQNYFNASFVKMLFQIKRFYRESEEVLHDERFASYSLLDYIREKRYDNDFVHKYIVPMSSALWSTPIDITLKYPVRALVQFFKNHGLLGISTQFQWYTVHHGSWQYRNKLIAPFKSKIQIGRAAKRIYREDGKVRIVASDGSQKIFDKVILACHADQAIRILADPTDLENKVLLNFQYQKNIATLHTDESIMPKIKSIWSAWNYRVESINGETTATTIYDMNILQGVSQKKNYFVSINDPNKIDQSKIIQRIEYEHPIFTTATAKGQRSLPLLNENGTTYFCGSYFRFGFHEDAFASAVNLCERILERNPWEARNPKMELIS